LARFDVFAGPEGTLLLDVQADLISGIATRVVVPLLPEGKTPPQIKRLNPSFDVGGIRYALFPQLISAVVSSNLSTPIINLRDRSDDIAAALDMLLYGFQPTGSGGTFAILRSRSQM
jgi:toxin CcdB